MVKPASAQSTAKSQSSAVRKVLHSLGQWIFPSERLLPGEIPQWESSFSGLLATTSLAGVWEVHGYWRYWSDPVDRSVRLRESSIGLTVSGHAVLGWPQEVCIARYDLELHGRRRGRHLNVYQPLIADRVHWIIPVGQFDDWPLPEALRFLVQGAFEELVGAGWPAP